MLKRFVCSAFFALSTLSKGYTLPGYSSNILILKIIDHPALDQTEKGIIDALKKESIHDGQNASIRIESAQGNAVLASQIAGQFSLSAKPIAEEKYKKLGLDPSKKKPHVCIAIGTVAAQSFLRYIDENGLNVVFSSVTDPLGAKLVKSLKSPGRKISGVSNFVELEPQILLFKKLQPKLKKMGFLYNPGESNSVAILKRLVKICEKHEITLVEQTITNTASVSQETTKLGARVDAIFISNDNTALGAISQIIQIANKTKIPVYVSDTDAVSKGALAALGPNQYDVGFQTGLMVAKVIKNSLDLSKTAVEFPKKTELYINKKAANFLRIEIPHDVLQDVACLVDD